MVVTTVVALALTLVSVDRAFQRISIATIAAALLRVPPLVRGALSHIPGPLRHHNHCGGPGSAACAEPRRRGGRVRVGVRAQRARGLRLPRVALNRLPLT